MPTVAQSTPTTAFVMKDGDKFVCMVDKDRISVSKHPDYVEYHLRRGDVKSLTDRGIDKIAYVDDNGLVTKIIDAGQKQNVAPKKVPIAVARAAVAAREAALAA